VPDLKGGKFRLGCGVEHYLWGHSNDYSYKVQLMSKFVLKNIFVSPG
jgi:hypothetical protein